MSAKGADPGAGDSGAAGSTGEPQVSHERNARRNRAPAPKRPKPTKRREFKFWLVMQLQAAGAQLTFESSYSEIKRALEQFEPFKPNADEGGAS